MDFDITARLEGKTVLVTGGTGFIGGRLVERLAQQQGVRVRALVRSFTGASRLGRFNIEMIRADLSDAGAVADAVKGCDLVMHCAHETKADPRTGQLTLTIGTRNLCEAILAAGNPRLVHLSSTGVYGQTRDGDLTEETPWQHDPHPYTKAKRETERLVRGYFLKDRLNAVILQPTIVYGPYCRPWTHGPVRDLRRGIVPLLDCGLGICNAVYVDDVVDAMVLAGVRTGVRGSSFIISGPAPVTWQNFYHAFEQVLGLQSTRAVPSVKLEHILAEQLRAANTWNRFRAWLSDPQGFRAIAKSPPLGYLVEGLRRAIHKTRAQGTVRRAKVPKPGQLHAQRLPHKELLVPNATLLALYRAHTHMRIDKACSLLGYQPRFDFEKGMRLTSEYLRWAKLAPTVPQTLGPSFEDPGVEHTRAA
jgi:nucleoside-diphosphate-sugar epimerase